MGEGSNIILKHGMQKNTSITLKEFETLLSSYSFFRPHQQYLINRQEILSVADETEPYIIMNNGNRIPLSVKKKDALISLLNSEVKA